MLWFSNKNKKTPSTLAVEERKKNNEALANASLVESTKTTRQPKNHIMDNKLIFNAFMKTFPVSIQLSISEKMKYRESESKLRDQLVKVSWKRDHFDSGYEFSFPGRLEFIRRTI